MEGCKRWRVYAPRCSEEALPRFSSPNFSQDPNPNPNPNPNQALPRFSSPNFRQDEIGEPVAELTLQAGE